MLTGAGIALIAAGDGAGSLVGGAAMIGFAMSIALAGAFTSLVAGGAPARRRSS